MATLAGASTSARAADADAAPLMRYPNTHDNRLVFAARGNLWTVDARGGTAQRLTDDPGTDMMPRFSPDGKWVAYTAISPGNQDVYVIPSAGGVPRRLTFRSTVTGPGTTTDGEDNIVSTWTPDSKYVVYLSLQRSWSTSDFRAFKVPVDGGLATPLALDRSGLFTFGPNDHTIAFTRGFTDFLTRKRYDGGLRQSVFTYDFVTTQLVKITDGQGSCSDPMWVGSKMYFVSDRDAARRANLWVYDAKTRLTSEITHYTDFDIDLPSLGDHAITFQQGGRLVRLDLPSEQLSILSVQVPDDGSRTRIRSVVGDDAIRSNDAISHTADFALAPDGKDTIVSARGTLVSVARDGAARSLTQTTAVDNDHPAVSPDGRFMVYTTDAGGEPHLAVRALAGGPERVLAALPHQELFQPIWSPGGAFIAVPDEGHNLWLLRADGRGRAVRVAFDPAATILDAQFSADGNRLAYSSTRPTQLRALHLYEIAGARDTVISDPLNDDRAPTFSADGRYLYFVSSRTPQALVSEANHLDLAAVKSDGIYQAELGDRSGIMRSAVQLPIAPTDVALLAARGRRVFYETSAPALIDGDLPGETSQLRVFDTASHTDTLLVNGLDGVTISADGSTAMYARDGQEYITDTAVTRRPDHAFDFEHVRVSVDPRREWLEMLRQAWRIERDAFVDRTTGARDWQRVYDAYAGAFGARMASRGDANYVIGQIIGELGSSHTFVGFGDSGDTRKPIRSARLGVDYALDAQSGRYRIAKIYRGDISRPEYPSPLTAPGIDVSEGEYLLAVDGHELAAPLSPDSLLVGVTGTVTLTIAASPNGARRNVMVKPLAGEFGLRKASMIAAHRARVDRLSGGRIGYVYLQDFFDSGARDFFRQFYGQSDKEGMIVDVRWNNGGFTSQFVLDALRRTAVGAFINREGASQTLPQGAISGPKAVLVNEYSSSDGDQFPYYFRAYGLGPVIGTTTWGGVRGLQGRWSLLDGGFVTAPDDALNAPGRTPIIENVGVAPDITVDSRPDEATTGDDAQLDAAVRAVMGRL